MTTSLDDHCAITVAVMVIAPAKMQAPVVMMPPAPVPAVVMMMSMVPSVTVLDDDGLGTCERRRGEGETCGSSEDVKNFLHIHSPVNHHVENADFRGSVPVASQENSEQMFRNALRERAISYSSRPRSCPR